MNTKVNLAFLSAMEGGPVCIGYVPDPDGSMSGVTIATGFDLGQCNAEQLDRMLTPYLAEKLRPYVGVKKHAAVELLNEKPLKVKSCDADIIDRCIKADAIKTLERLYDLYSDIKFSELPEHAQTVIFSVGYQYGNLPVRCPKFWKLAVNQDYQGMVDELNNFGDRYPTRRKKEAKLLSLVCE